MTVPDRMRFIDMTVTGGPEVLTLAREGADSGQAKC